MKTKLNRNVLLTITACIAFFVFAFNGKENSKTEIKRNINFNEGWKYINKNFEKAEHTNFDDTSWRIVDLPHDISVEDLPIQDSIHIGPFYKGVENGEDVGYLKGGTAWYRKHFVVNLNDKDKQFILNFDGVQSEAVIYVNGKEAGEHKYGYTPFNINITPFLNNLGQDNVIALKVTNPEVNSRWFAGFGIYRDVTLSIVNPIRIADWGVFVNTPQISNEKATINTAIQIQNSTNENGNFKLIANIISPDKSIVKTIEQPVNLSSLEITKTSIELSIPKPLLWDLDSPNLYSIKLSLFRNDNLEDEYSVDFGIRSLECSAKKGFLLNGKKVLLKGACMHHDNGLLGAAAFKHAEYRKVAIMKKNGFNAIRTSHNAPSKHFLDACDKLGMLVIDEAFDMWKAEKRKNDYHNNFDKYWDKDLEAMILRDRNHPSIIMWSYGNEIPERARPKGIEIAKNLVIKIKSLDTSRPTTSAINDFTYDNSDQNWELHSPYSFAIMDVAGYNYMPEKYESDHQLYPERVMYCSESFPNKAFDYWKKVEKLSYVIGDFVWTGMDHIGEVGLGSSIITNKNIPPWQKKSWPWYVNNCGDIDIIGNKKPQGKYRDVLWKESTIEILVHQPVPNGIGEKTTFWGWPLETSSWNWEEHKGELLNVNVYSSFPKVKLYLNNKLIGEEKIDLEKGITASFKVPYKKGILKAVGIDKDNNQTVKILKTVGQFKQIDLKADNQTIKANRNELVYISVSALDREKNIIPTASNPINIQVQGEAELIAAGNSKPTIEGSLKDNTFNLYNGLGLIILRSNGKEGKITLKVTSENGISKKININSSN